MLRHCASLMSRYSRRNVGAPEGVGAVGRMTRRYACRQRHRTPLALGREGHLCQGRPSGGLHSFGDRLARLVGGPAAGDHEADPRAGAGLVALERHHLVQLQLVGRERAGLVHAQRVHVRERLHRVGLLHQRPEARHAHRGKGIGDGDRDEEAVGHEAYQHGGLDDGLVERRVIDHVLDDEQQLQVEHHAERHADDRLDLALERRERAPEGLGAGRDAPREAGFADRPRDVAATARRRDSCRRRPRRRLAWGPCPTRRSAGTRRPPCDPRRARRRR